MNKIIKEILKRVSIRFAWYDIWIGVFWNSSFKILYICPLPMLLIKINLWNPDKEYSRGKKGDS